MMLSFEACREPLTADELDDCGVVLDSCTIPDLYEASAALCATSYEVDCACVNEELECFEFVSATRLLGMGIGRPVVSRSLLRLDGHRRMCTAARGSWTRTRRCSSTAS